jgi:hypothetical protein
MNTVIEIIRLLRASPATAEGLALAMESHKNTTNKWLRLLHKERVIFIAGWLADSRGRDKTPIFAFGDSEDLPKKVLSRSEISRRYREKKQEGNNGGHARGQGQESNQEDSSGQLDLFRDANR